MITAEMDGTPKHESVCKTVDALDFALASTCLEVWKQLQVLPRIGSFMAAQVVADLKRTKYLGPSPDYWSFYAPGPGSMEGLNKLLDKSEGTCWTQQSFQKEVNELQNLTSYVLDAQKVQNCFCEFHKWTRRRTDAAGNPWLGIGYHFVIGNGQGMPDGHVESTFRWKDQIHGAHTGNAAVNARGVGICLIGNFEKTSPTEKQIQSLKSAGGGVIATASHP